MSSTSIPGLEEMNEQARLGAAVGPPVLLEPPPINQTPGPFGLLILGAALIGLSAWVERGRPAVSFDWSSLSAALGAFCIVVGLVALIRRFLSRGSLTLHEKGFVFARGRTRTGLLFDEVESLALRERQRASYGAPLGIERRATVRGATGTLRFTHLSLHKRPDGAGPFLIKLIEKLADTAEARLRAAGTLDGAGWSLGPDGLRHAGGELPVPIPSLARVGVFQHHVSLWRDGEERPFLSVGSDTPNALVLGRLMALRLRDRPETARAGELGRVLFEQRSHRTGIYSVVFGLAIGASYFWLTSLPDPPNDLSRWLMGVAAVLSVATGVYLWTRVVRRHENGLSMSSLAGRREVLYSDLERMQYSEQAQYHNGIYTGTTFSLTARSAGGKPITFSTSSRGDKDDLDRLRSFLAERIAAKLRARLSHHAEVPWTPGVLLSQEGVRFAPVKFIGRRELVLVKFSERPQSTIAKGFFQLTVPGRKGAQVRILCSAENFYPGFILFQTLAAAAAKAV